MVFRIPEPTPRVLTSIPPEEHHTKHDVGPRIFLCDWEGGRQRTDNLKATESNSVDTFPRPVLARVIRDVFKENRCCAVCRPLNLCVVCNVTLASEGLATLHLPVIAGVIFELIWRVVLKNNFQRPIPDGTKMHFSNLDGRLSRNAFVATCGHDFSRSDVQPRSTVENSE